MVKSSNALLNYIMVVLLLVITLVFTFTVDDNMKYRESQAISGNWIDNRAGGFASGHGTEEQPFEIETAGQLADLAYRVNNNLSYLYNNYMHPYKNAYYNITADIDLSAHYWTPIGTEDNSFSGYINYNSDGGYVISGLYTTDGASYHGLFGYITNATIKGIGLEDGEIGGINYIGGMVGYAVESTIEECYNSIVIDAGVVSLASNVGGIVGYALDCSIVNCYNTADVWTYYTLQSSTITGQPTGGIVGHAETTQIYSCYNTGTITSGTCVGGIAGQVYESTMIYNCFNTGDVAAYGDSVASQVEGQQKAAGGIVGFCSGDDVRMEYCYNVGDIILWSSDYDGAGSIAGFVSSTTNAYQNIFNNCFYESGQNVLFSRNSETRTLYAFGFALGIIDGHASNNSSQIWELENGHANATDGLNSMSFRAEGVNQIIDDVNSWNSTYYTWGDEDIWILLDTGFPILNVFNKPYNIVYELGDGYFGSGSQFSNTAYIGDIIEVSNPISPDGYAFIGWTAEGLNVNDAWYGSSIYGMLRWSNGTTIVHGRNGITFFRDLALAKQTVTLIANYELIRYNVEFSIDDEFSSSSISSINISYGSIFNIANPTPNSGYVFTGWSSEDINTSTAMSGTSSSNLESWNGVTTTDRYFMNLRSTVGNVTLVANFRPVVYSFVFLDDSGVSINNYIVSYGDTFTFPSYQGDLDVGTTFDSWYISYSPSTSYNAGQRITIGDYGGDGQTVIFMPTIREVEYQVIFRDTYNNTQDTITIDYSDLISYEPPTLEGYTFAGWQVTGAVYSRTAVQGVDTTSPSTRLQNPTNPESNRFRYLTITDGASILFTATYEPISYQVNIDYNNGTNIVSMDVDYDSYLSVNIPTYTGYTFTGWAVSATNSPDFNFETARYGYNTTNPNIEFDPSGDYYLTSDDANSFINLSTTQDGQVTLVAQWEGNITQVTLYGNGGTVGNSSQVIVNLQFGSTVNNDVSNYIPTLENYVFLGYYTDIANDVQVYDENGEAVLGTSYFDEDGQWCYNQSSLSLYAHWQGERYSTPLNANGGRFSNGAEEMELEQEYGSSSNRNLANSYMPEREGYEFLGFYLYSSSSADDEQIYDENLDAVLNSEFWDSDGSWIYADDIVMYAQWDRIEYQVTFDPNEGEFDDGVDLKTLFIGYLGNENQLLPDGYLPIRTGYIFLGYYTQNGVEVFDENGSAVFGNSYWNSNGQWIYANDLTVYADWEEIEYSVVVDNNNNTQANLPQSLYFNDVLQVEIPEYAGYDFVGWLADGIDIDTALYGENGTPNQSFTDNMTSALANRFRRLSSVEDGIVTLTAQWEPSTFTVTLDANGGSVEPSTIDVTYLDTYGGNVGGTLPIPTYEGYLFKGWYSESDGGEQILASTVYTLADDSTIYAQWEDTWANHASDELTQEGSYYIVNSEQDLALVIRMINFSSQSSYLNMNIRLTSDLDMSDYTWYPIGTSNRAFRGVFEGNGHIITGLQTYYNENVPNYFNYIGLFGYTNGATIENLFVRGVDVVGGSYVGGIVGYAIGSTNINGCAFSGTITGSSIRRGALVGYGASTVRINDCTIFSANTETNENGIARGCTIVTCVFIINGQKGYIGSDFSNYVYVEGLTAPVSQGLSWLAQGGESCTLEDVQNWASSLDEGDVARKTKIL